MKTRNSLVALVLVLMLVFSMSAAVADDDFYCNKEGYPICKDVIQVTCAHPYSYTPGNDTMAKQVILDRFNIDIDFTEYSSDEWNTKLSLMISGDTLPDIIAGAAMDRAQVNLWGADGYFADWTDYLDWAPNLVQMFEMFPSLKATFSADDGSIYGLNQVNPAAFSNSQLVYMNNQWLKNVGKELPTTTDELYDVLKTFKEQDANGNGDTDDEIPAAYTASLGGLEKIVMNAYGIKSADLNYSLVIDDEGKVSLANLSDNYKGYLTFMNKLYSEGLVDAECYIQTDDELRSKTKQEIVGVVTGDEPCGYLGKTVEEDANWDAIFGLTSEMNDTPIVMTSSGVKNNVRMAISSTCEYPEALIRLIDYYYTDEGRVEVRYGYEGYSFEWVTDSVVGGSCPAYINGDKAKEFGLVDPNKEYNKFDYFLNYTFDVWFYTAKFDTCAALDYNTMSDEDYLALVNAYGWVAPFYKSYNDPKNVVFETYPNVCFTQEEAAERTQLYNDISNIIKADRVAFITGEANIEADWDSYVAEVTEMGLERLIEIEQAAYDRYIANV